MNVLYFASGLLLGIATTSALIGGPEGIVALFAPALIGLVFATAWETSR